ncbi:N-acetylglutamate synthase, mitochondrial-like [Dendronephthya gigantea]|uniref:N-acetylglutamate synthase, mitochondrial-like n=1 Tax=Dendronephthya gigantea TaxID=151771 RepID=UPI00106950F8|nr:N-acetylglutamate synthase, mitochondrial-like [Dendronephthya gigantea]
MDKLCRRSVKTLSCCRFTTASATFALNTALPTDLRRFLEEVGSDPKEARFWLRQFQYQANDPKHPFAVLQAGSSILHSKEAVKILCSSLSFLNRNGMPTVLVYGPDQDSCNNEKLFHLAQQLQQQEMQLVDCLEKFCHADTRAFCGASGILQSQKSHSRLQPVIDHVNADPITWTFRSGRVPLLTSVSIERRTGRLTPICSRHVAIKLSEVLKPMKVIFLNETGGLFDEHGKVISHIRIPGDIQNISQESWCTTDIKNQIDEIASLSKDLSKQTQQTKTEAIHRYKSLEEVNVPKTDETLNSVLQKALKPEYMTVVQEYLQSVYISENYTAAAIVIHDREKSEIPYLDKFVISSACQGQGTSDDLWNHLTQDFSSLFWRSRATNRINPWYFIRADGSWTNGDWIIFWYGVDEPRISHDLVEFAGTLPESFDPIANHDVTMKSENRSTTSYIQLSEDLVRKMIIFVIYGKKIDLL